MKRKCPFCEIDSERTKIIFDGKFVRVVLSNPCKVEGHLLVVPKRHVERLSELNSDERKELFDTVIRFQEKIISKISSGCNISQHYMPFVGESDFKVNHIHFHLLPRELNDELYKKVFVNEKDVFRFIDKTESDKVSDLYK